MHKRNSRDKKKKQIERKKNEACQIYVHFLQTTKKREKEGRNKQKERKKVLPIKSTCLADKEIERKGRTNVACCVFPQASTCFHMRSPGQKF